jgi:cytochrome oxidase Cu insertion factor (SCO1/SenC/PrrC family)
MRGPAHLGRIVTGITLAGVLLGCSGTGSLHGVVRSDPLQVGHVVLPDVTDPSRLAGGVVEDGLLTMRAREGRLLVVSFGFLNCPDVCPTTLADLRSAIDRLDDDARGRVDVVFVTVDPDRDGPEELAAYLRHFAPRHHAVRGTGAELKVAMDAFLASARIDVAADGTIEVAHTAVLYAVDATGSVVVEWPFGTDAAALSDDLSTLLRRIA